MAGARCVHLGLDGGECSYRAVERPTAVVLSYDCIGCYLYTLDTISIHLPPQRTPDSPAVHETSEYGDISSHGCIRAIMSKRSNDPRQAWYETDSRVGESKLRKVRQADHSMGPETFLETFPDPTRDLPTTLFGYKNVTGGEQPSALDMGGLYKFLVIAPKPVSGINDTPREFLDVCCVCATPLMTS